jgi:hypothetical protein
MRPICGNSLKVASRPFGPASVTHSGLIARLPISPASNYLLIEKWKAVSPGRPTTSPNAPRVTSMLAAQNLKFIHSSYRLNLEIQVNYLLIGNGVNLQFSRSEYNNSGIINRAIIKTKQNRNPSNAYPYEVLKYLNMLYSEYQNTVRGINDQLMSMDYERQSLSEFKKRYKDKLNLKIEEIGFEDYFLLHEIFCRKNHISNPERYQFQVVLRRFFIDAIYFNNRINKLWRKFPESFVNYLNGFDEIFTTNYDSNIKAVYRNEVRHLHGAFDELDDVYNDSSFRNKLPDCKDVDRSFVKSHPYLFSTALSTYSGSLKQYSMERAELANRAIEGFSNGYNNNSEIRNTVDGWCNAGNELIENLGEAIKLKSSNSKLEISENYALKIFKKINGRIDILGLSPNNDAHIFNLIDCNDGIQFICFYYWDDEDIKEVKTLLKHKEIHFECAKSLWTSF